MPKTVAFRPFAHREITLGQASEAFRLRCQAQSLSEGTLTWYRELLRPWHRFLDNIRNGGDSFSLQDILGHSTLEMTRRYVHLARRDVSEQDKKFSPIDGLGRVAVARVPASA